MFNLESLFYFFFLFVLVYRPREIDFHAIICIIILHKPDQSLIDATFRNNVLFPAVIIISAASAYM